jgi:hypothetical protein
MYRKLPQVQPKHKHMVMFDASMVLSVCASDGGEESHERMERWMI